MCYVCYDFGMSVRRRMPKFDWYAVRWVVLERDQFTCRYCGQFAPNVRLEVDHITPVCEGGTDALDNLVTACGACNRGKEAYRAGALYGRQRQARGSMKAPPATYPTPSIDVLRDTLRDHPEGLTFRDLSRLTGRNRSTLVRTVKRAIEAGVPITVEQLPGSGGNPQHLYRLVDAVDAP